MIKSMLTASYRIDEGVSQEYRDCLEKCRDYLKSHTDDVRDISGQVFNQKIRELIETFIEETHPCVPAFKSGDIVNTERLASALYMDVNEYGVITTALTSGEYTDIYCNGVGPGNLLVSKGREQLPLRDYNDNIQYFSTPEEIKNIVNKLAFHANQRLSTSNPILYSETLHGYRLTASDESISSPVIMPDGSKQKTSTFSIRMKASKPITLEEMVYKHKTIHPTIANVLRIIGKLENIKVLFSGAPGTGKTTIMTELIKETRNKMIYVIENVPEISLWMYDDKGNAITRVKALVATHGSEQTKDVSIPTVYNLYLMSLREKVDIMCLGEVRSVDEIKVMMEGAVAGQGVWATIHGEDEETTMERLVKTIGEVKSSSRSEAMEEAYLSVNIIINLYLDKVDGKIRLQSISEVTKEETEFGIRVKTNKLFDFHKYRRGINPDTGMVYGVYRKVGVPTERLMRYIRNTNLTDEEEQLLTMQASYDKPVMFEEVW